MAGRYTLKDRNTSPLAQYSGIGPVLNLDRPLVWELPWYFGAAFLVYVTGDREKHLQVVHPGGHLGLRYGRNTVRPQPGLLPRCSVIPTKIRSRRLA